MGFRFRKSINLGGGFRINLSKSGVGYSWGTKGFRITKAASGQVRTTFYIPKAGISYVSKGASSKTTRQRKNSSAGSFHKYTAFPLYEDDDSPFSDTLPDSETFEVHEVFRYELRSIDSDFSAILNKPVVIIGRQGELKEHLCNKEYVSRAHAKLSIIDDNVFIKNVSATNKTFVNNELVPDGTSLRLKDGDEIGLGGKVIDGKRQEHAAYLVFRSK